MNFQRVAVKIGSNVLTRANGTLDITRMSALVDQVCELHKAGVEVILITSGAMASGRSELVNIKKLDTVSARQLYSAVGQAKLINRYFELFRDHGIACGQILTTKENFSTRAHYLNQKHCIEVMLDNGVIPIVNENDTISVTELMFTDNDELSGLIATMMSMEALIILSNVDGIFDGDPSLPQSRVIPTINSTQKSDDIQFISKTKSSFGRGGMQTKFNIAGKVAAEGISVIIANGKRDGVLTSLVMDSKPIEHTLFVPAARTVSGVKKWLAHSEGFAKGEIHIDDKAYQALISPNAVSLLPVGVINVKGDFEKDDIVRIISPNGKQIGVGKVSINSDKARATAGTQGGKPVIHYDYLYLD